MDKKNYRSPFLSEPVPKEIDRYLDYSLMITRIIIDKLRSESITQQEFARSLGKKEPEVSAWLSGRHHFSIRTLSEISIKYDLDLSEAFKMAPEDEIE